MRPFKDFLSTVLWAAISPGYTAACLVRLVPVGIDVRVDWNGEELKGRIFEGEGEAVAWAEEERQELLAKGWTEISVGPPSRTR